MEKTSQLYCLNCNRYNHNSKKCSFGVISNGVIVMHSKVPINYDKFEIFFNQNIENYIINPIMKHPPNENIRFLMVQRKHSLGFGELVRGHYDPKAIDSINYILKQMTDEEINMIKDKTFDELWNIYWSGDGISNPKHISQFNSSKKKFEFIKNKYSAKDFVNSEYNFNEWGFPKGRRELYEDNLKCAIREFMEETDIRIINYINKKKSIQENLIGTNGIKYVHNYYVGFIEDANIHKPNNNEVGSVKLMTFNECLTYIRPYHLDKINIIKILYNMVNDFLLL